MILLLAGPALALDGPAWWLREAVGAGFFPDGVQSVTVAEYRAPMHRSSSIVFQDTYAGAGARLVVTPVYADVAPIVSLAPIDVFDCDLAAGWIGYFSWGGQGLLPYDTPAHKLTSERVARTGEDVSTGMLYASAVPTLKAKVGPVIAFDSWTVIAHRLDRPAGATAPYVYEPARDLVVAWTDVTTEQQAGLLVELLPGGTKPLLDLGATWRNRRAYVSGDRSGVLGGLLVVRPGTKPIVPTAVVQGLFYVVDADRVGREPNLQVQLTWDLERPAVARAAPPPAGG